VEPRDDPPFGRNQGLQLYQLLWETTTDAVLIISADNIIRFANCATASVLGYAPEDLVGQPLGMVQPPEMRERHAAAMAAYLKTGQRRLNWRGTEAVAMRADGERVPVEISFSHLHREDGDLFAAFIRDVSERKRQQEELARSEARFRALTELSSDVYWELDEHLRISRISRPKRSGRLHGMDQDLGHLPWEAPGLDMSPQERHSLRAVLEQHQGYRDIERVYRTPEGTRLVLSESAEPVLDREGRFCGYRGVARDITEQRESEEQKAALEQRLRDAQKLEAIGLLAGGVAHDFNNILAGILANADLALQDLDPPHGVVDRLRHIGQAGRRARDLVQQLLAFARRQPGRREHIELQPVLDESLALLKATLSPSVELTTTVEGKRIALYADPTQVEQALLNLCTNAAQALGGRPGHVHISVRTTELEDSTAQRLGLRIGQPHAALAVRDDGPGMTDEVRRRVFEPFFTTKPKGSGTGLGLSVVHGIVAAHGGAIDLESSPGGGSTFTIYLPLDSAPDVDAPKPQEAPEWDGRGEHVLCVDDDEFVSMVMDELLRRGGYELTLCRDPAEALRVFHAGPERFDALLTDLAMPGMTGIELITKVRTISPNLPVVLTSGNLDHETAQQLPANCLKVRKEHLLEELPKALAALFSRG
jgi:PAS domain S-box-containing protein